MKPDRRWAITPEGQLASLVQIKHRDTGEVIFQRNVEGNSVAKTLRIAIILGVSVKHADLSGQDLSHGYFIGGRFQYCDFTGSIMTGANFLGAKFDNASMSKIVDSCYTVFEGATFHKTFAAGSNFKGAYFKGALGMETHFGEQTSQGKVVLPGSDLSGCDLRGFASRGANFRGIIIDDKTLLDESDTRISYEWPRHKVSCVCDGACQNCVGCESPQKYETFGDLASPGKMRTY